MLVNSEFKLSLLAGGKSEEMDSAITSFDRDRDGDCTGGMPGDFKLWDVDCVAV